MHAIEFKTIIKNGLIEIPQQYRENFKSHVRVILLSEESSKAIHSFIDELLAHPIRVMGFHPLTREEAHAR
jgi:hypothetical protein